MDNYSQAKVDMRTAFLEAADLLLDQRQDRMLEAMQVAVKAMWVAVEWSGGQEVKSLSLLLQVVRWEAWRMRDRAERKREAVREDRLAVLRQRGVLEAARRAQREALLSPAEDQMVEEAILEWTDKEESEGLPPLRRVRLPREAPQKGVAPAARVEKRATVAKPAQVPPTRARRSS